MGSSVALIGKGRDRGMGIERAEQRLRRRLEAPALRPIPSNNNSYVRYQTDGWASDATG
jgi:hypothetical protein